MSTRLPVVYFIELIETLCPFVLCSCTFLFLLIFAISLVVFSFVIHEQNLIIFTFINSFQILFPRIPNQQQVTRIYFISVKVTATLHYFDLLFSRSRVFCLISIFKIYSISFNSISYDYLHFISCLN